MDSFKVLIIGLRASGKTTFLSRSLNEEFDEIHHPTPGVVIQPIISTFSNSTKVCFNCWETENVKETYSGTNAIIAISTPSVNNFTKTEELVDDAIQMIGSVPVIFCANFPEVPNSSNDEEFTECRYNISTKYYYCEISGKSGFNIQLPFLWLGRILTKNKNLEWDFV